MAQTLLVHAVSLVFVFCFRGSCYWLRADEFAVAVTTFSDSADPFPVLLDYNLVPDQRPLLEGGWEGHCCCSWFVVEAPCDESFVITLSVIVKQRNLAFGFECKR